MGQATTRTVASVTEPKTIDDILEHLRRTTTAPSPKRTGRTVEVGTKLGFGFELH